MPMDAWRRADAYLPVHTGLRFSAKAVAPSLASAEVKIWAIRGRCESNISAWLQSRDWVTMIFAVCTASGTLAATTRASSRDAPSVWPGSTRRLTRPKLLERSAENITQVIKDHMAQR